MISSDVGNTEDSRFSAAIIGLGDIGVGYDLFSSHSSDVLTHAKALLQHPRFLLLGGVDTNPTNRERFTKLYSLPAFESVEALTKNLQPDTIVVAVPMEQHLLICRELKGLSLKGVIIEKPVGCSTAEAKEIAEIFHANGTCLFVNYIRRSDPGIKEISRIIAANKYGTLKAMQVVYARHLYTNATHIISLCIDWFGMPKDVVVFDCHLASDSQTDFNASFVLKYESFSITFSCLSSSRNIVCEFDLFFEFERIRCVDFSWRIEHGKVSQYESGPPTVYSPEPFTIPSEMSRYQYNVLTDFHSKLSTEVFNWSSIDNAIAVHEICARIRPVG